MLGLVLIREKILISYIISVLMLFSLAGCFEKNDPESRMQRATQYIADANYPAAMIEFKNILKKDKNHINARLGLAKIYFSNKNYTSSKNEYEKAYELAKNNSVEVGYLRSLIEMREVDKAFTFLGQSSIEDNQSAADDAQINLLYALIYLAKSKPKLAVNYLDEIENPGANADVQTAFARAAIALNNHNQAFNFLERAEVLSPDDLSIKVVMAQLHLYEDEKDLAVKKLEEVIKHDAKSRQKYIQFEARLIKSQILLSQKKSSEAEEELLYLHQIDPDNSTTNYYLALISFQKKNYSLSGSYLSKSLGADENHASSLYLMSLVKFSQKHFVQAEQFINRYLKQYDDDVVAKKLLARIKLASNRPTDVFNIFDVSESLLDDDAELLSILAQAALKSGDIKLAEKYLGKSLVQNTENNQAVVGVARIYLANNEFDKAIELLKKDSNKLSQDFEIYTLLVRANIAKGNNQEALSLVDSDSVFKKENSEHYMFSGDVYQTLGEIGKARNSFNKALSLDVTNTILLFKAAEIEVLNGNTELALDHYKTINEVEPDNIIAWTLRAKLLHSRGSNEEAIQLVSKRLSGNEQSFGANLGAAEFYFYTRKWGLAEEYAKTASTLEPENGYARYLLSEALLNQNKVKESRVIVKTLLHKEAKNISYQMLLGKGYLLEENRQFAKQIFNQILQQDPRYLPAALSLLKIEIENNNYSEAINIINSQKEFYPVNIDLELALAKIEFRNEKYIEAGKMYGEIAKKYSYPLAAIAQYEAALKSGDQNSTLALERWVKKFPDNSELKSALGSELIRVGRYKAAAAHFEQIINSHQNENTKVEEKASALNNLAWVYGEINDPRGVEFAKAAHKLLPNAGAIQDTLGWLLVLNGDAQEGKVMLEQAMEKLPDNPDVAYHFAYALLESGESVKAKKILENHVFEHSNYHSETKAKELYARLND